MDERFRHNDDFGFFSHLCKGIITNGSDNVLQLWSTKDGSLLKICSREGKDGMDSLHGGWLSDLHFSKDNRLLVSTGGYVKVCLFINACSMHVSIAGLH